MKLRALVACAGFVCAFSSSAQDSLTNGLVAYYPLDGNANDASGNGNNGAVLNGATFVSDRFGGAGSALSCNGANSGAVQVPDSAAIRFGPAASITVALWVYRIGTTDTMHIIGKRHACAVAETPDRPTYQMAFSPLEGLAFGAGLYNEVRTGMGLMTNTWKHLAGTCDGSTYRFYIDGALVATTNGTLGSAITNSLIIGGSGTCQGFQGVLDDVRIYNRALSDAEVGQLYAFQPFCSPRKAKALPQVVNGFVVGATLTDSGCGYTNPPLVLIKGDGGSGATATATISNGAVVAINITSPGCCYSTNPPPTIEIASPPFVPALSIGVSKVKVTQYVVLGRNYVLESSFDLTNWTAVGPPFTASSETLVNEFDVDVTGRFFRIREVP
jgi:hypothetical protein